MRALNSIFTLALSFAACKAVHISGLDVPSVALTGDKVRLRCEYLMDERSSLYSLKWYKDGKEFYRHVPGNGQSAAQRCSVSVSTPSVPGITIDCWASSEREVVLVDVSRETSGEYRCEVIGDHPGFRREERKARLTVYSEALQKPTIQGMEREYALGSKVTLNCSSRNKEYVPDLIWLINGKPPKEHEVSYPFLSSQGTLSLHFTADEAYFIHGQVQVVCKASLSSSHVQSSSKTLSIPGLLRPQYFSAGVSPSQEEVLSFLLLFMLVAFK